MTTDRAGTGVGARADAGFRELSKSLCAMVAAAGEKQLLTAAVQTAIGTLGLSFAEASLDSGIHVRAGSPSGSAATEAPIRIGTDPVGLFRAEGADVTPERLQLLADVVGAVVASRRLSDGLRREVRYTRDQLDAAKAMESARDRFLTTLSHELRTPLTSIRSLAEVLLTSEVDPETAKEFVSIVHEESMRLTRLVTRLLDLDRLHEGRLDWDMRPGDPEAAIEAARRSVTAYAAEHGVRVEVAVAHPLPAVSFDHDRIVQVLVNLMMNAIRFSPEGEKVSLSAEACGGGVRFIVADRGAGIPEADRQRVFERFRTAANCDGPKGVGLGLAICREIATAHGGSIFVEDGDGPGARLVLQI